MKFKPGDVIAPHKNSAIKVILMGITSEGIEVMFLKGNPPKYKITFIRNDANYEWVIR